MLFQQIITWGSTFLLMLFLPRYLGPVEYGRLYLAGSLVEIFRVLVSYGGNYLVAKHVSRSPENTGQVLVDAAAFRFIFAIISIGLIIGFAHLVDYPAEVRVLMSISGIALLWAGASIALYASYQGHELLKYTSAGAIAERVFTSVACIAALLLGGGAQSMILLMLVGSFLNFAVLAGFSRKIVQKLPRVNWSDAKNQIREGLPYFLFAIFGTIYYRIDSLMLSRFAPEEVVGWYGGGYRLFDAMNFLPYIFSNAIYPVLARLWTTEELTHKRTMHKSLEFMILAGVPIAAGVIVYAGKLVHLFYGTANYENSIIVLQILSCGLVFLYVDMVLGTTLLAADKQRRLSYVSLSAIFVNVTLNYFLIPFFQSHFGNGGIGSALATVSTEFYVLMAALRLLPSGLMSDFRFSVLFKAIGAGCAMGVVAFTLLQTPIPWVIHALLCPVLYVGALLVLRTFEPEERIFLRDILRLSNVRSMWQTLRHGQ
jgi:O-antigen/teichoic acid export membrane protein